MERTSNARKGPGSPTHQSVVKALRGAFFPFFFKTGGGSLSIISPLSRILLVAIFTVYSPWGLASLFGCAPGAGDSRRSQQRGSRRGTRGGCDCSRHRRRNQRRRRRCQRSNGGPRRRPPRRHHRRRGPRHGSGETHRQSRNCSGEEAGKSRAPRKKRKKERLKKEKIKRQSRRGDSSVCFSLSLSLNPTLLILLLFLSLR